MDSKLTEVENRVGQTMEAFGSELTKVRELLSQGSSSTLDPVLSGSVQTCLQVLQSAFTIFRQTISKELQSIRVDLTRLEERQDGLEQYSRRSCLLLMGVAEDNSTNEEDTERAVLDVIKNKLKLDLTGKDIERTHRLGPRLPGKTRPIIVKFVSYKSRALVFSSKSRLKQSPLYITESLTKSRLDLLNAARDRFGVKRCWTSDGKILINIESGNGPSRRQVVTTRRMLSQILDPTPSQSLSARNVDQPSDLPDTPARKEYSTRAKSRRT